MTGAMAIVPLWNPEVPLPPAGDIPDLDAVTHRIVERAQPGGFHYLHTTTLAWHRDHLYVGWAGHPTHEVNLREECVRGRRSPDGGVTWAPAETWVAPPTSGAAGFNHSVIAACHDRLWGFFTRWDDEKPGTEIFVRDDATGRWETTGAVIPGFISFGPPRRMPEGHWIVSGEMFWYEGAMAISHGDDFSRWDVVRLPRPKTIDLHFAEPTLMEREGGLMAILRPRQPGFAPVSVSADAGRTWSMLTLSNFPVASSKPCCGRLSTDRHYLLTNHREEGRTLLTIAVTAPGGLVFERIWKVRHQSTPRRRLFGGWGDGAMVGQPTEWSYPSAVERGGQLYISYTQGKEDAWLSVIPVSALGG
jgi:hypothetical protein